MTTETIVIVPYPRPTPGKSYYTGKYDSWLDGEHICRSRTPFVSSARVLLDQGYPSDTILRMQHEGSNTIALTGAIGKAAKLTVRESDDGLRFGFEPFTPHPRG